MSPDELCEIYRARNMQEAALLKDRLEEEGIPATVMNNVLEGGAGVDVLGWSTQPRVMVAETDAGRARAIALDYERRGAERLRGRGAQQDDDDSDDDWPCCPSCGRGRLTYCPHCGTSGTDFPAGDTDLSSLLGLEPTAPGAASCCGPGGCTPQGTEEIGHSERSEESRHSEQGEESESDASSPSILLCPTCDEPFAPQYLRRCEWCGHEFPDGVEFDPPLLQRADINNRLIFAVAALVLVVVALAAYLFWLF